jgi:flagellar motor switch protein FliG
MNVLSDFTILVEDAIAIKNTQRPKKVKNEEPKKTSVRSTLKRKEEMDFKSLDFDSIINLSDSKIKTLMKNLEIETVSIAMKGAHKEIREKVEKNLGKRALKIFKDLLQQTKHVSEAEIKKSRKLIEKQIKLLTK